MSNNTIYLVQGDTGPDIRFTLRDSNTGDPADPDSWDPIDLSPANTTVLAKYKRPEDSTLLDSVAAAIVGDGTEGKVTVVPSSTVMNDEIGVIEIELTIDYDGSPQTVQDKATIQLQSQFPAV